MSLEMDQESSGIVLVCVCVCRQTWVRGCSSIFHTLYSTEGMEAAQKKNQDCTILWYKNRCWSRKWPNVESNCTQIQIVGLFCNSRLFVGEINFIRHFLTERYRNWISWYLDVYPSWCRHFLYLGFLTVAPATNFARKRVKTRYLTLFRATKNCVVICRASLLYEMGYYPFRSTVFVPMEF